MGVIKNFVLNKFARICEIRVIRVQFYNLPQIIGIRKILFWNTSVRICENLRNSRYPRPNF